MNGRSASHGTGGRPDVSADAIALASAGASPGGTSRPNLPLRRISLAPLGQSMATTGVPTASASMRTVGSPSKREDKASTAERAMQAYGLSTKPGRAADGW